MQKQGKNDEAVAAFDQATKLKPTWAKPWNSKGWALYKLGKFEEALASFDKAISLEPKWDKPWFNKAKIFYDLHKYSDAKISIDHAFSINEDPKTSALQERINKKIQQQLASIDREISLEPKLDKPWFNKAKIFYDLHKYSDAKIFADHAFSINPDPETSALQERINKKIQQQSTTAPTPTAAP